MRSKHFFIMARKLGYFVAPNEKFKRVTSHHLTLPPNNLESIPNLLLWFNKTILEAPHLKIPACIYILLLSFVI